MITPDDIVILDRLVEAEGNDAEIDAWEDVKKFLKELAHERRRIKMTVPEFLDTIGTNMSEMAEAQEMHERGEIDEPRNN